jgi:hypothetical protein
MNFKFNHKSNYYYNDVYKHMSITTKQYFDCD